MNETKKYIRAGIVSRLVNVHKQYDIPLNSLLKSFNLDHFIEYRLKDQLTKYGHSEYERGFKEASQANAVDNDGNPIKISLS